jgi:RNAse (barnase) inhibitor barstar
MSDIRDLVGAPPEPGVYRWRRAPSAEDVSRIADRAGWRWWVLDGSAARDKPSFLAACMRAFSLPDWFGRNWDALEESLTDLAGSAARAPASIVLYDRWARFATAQPEEWATALDILQGTVERWRRRSAPLYVMLRGEGPPSPGLRDWP